MKLPALRRCLILAALLVVTWFSLPRDYRYLAQALPLWLTLKQYQKDRITSFFAGHRSRSSFVTASVSEPSQEIVVIDAEEKRSYEWADISTEDDSWPLSEETPWLWDVGSELHKRPDIRLKVPR